MKDSTIHIQTIKYNLVSGLLQFTEEAFKYYKYNTYIEFLQNASGEVVGDRTGLGRLLWWHREGDQGRGLCAGEGAVVRRAVTALDDVPLLGEESLALALLLLQLAGSQGALLHLVLVGLLHLLEPAHPSNT